MKITKDILIYNGACVEQRDKFLKLWPDGLEVTVKNIELVGKKRYTDMVTWNIPKLC